MNGSDDSAVSEHDRVTLSLFGVPVAVAAIFAFLDWTGWVWMSFGFGIVVFTLAFVWVVLSGWKCVQGEGAEKFYGGLVLMFMFPFFCGTVFELWGSDAFISDRPLAFSHWVWLTVENIGGVLLLDMFDVYGIKLSPIKHNATFWPSTLVFLFRTAVAFDVVLFVLRSYGEIPQRWARESAHKTV